MNCYCFEVLLLEFNLYFIRYLCNTLYFKNVEKIEMLKNVKHNKNIL